MYFDNGSYVGVADKEGYNKAVDVGFNLLPYLLNAIDCSHPTTEAQSATVYTLRRLFDAAARCKVA